MNIWCSKLSQFHERTQEYFLVECESVLFCDEQTNCDDCKYGCSTYKEVKEKIEKKR